MMARSAAGTGRGRSAADPERLGLLGNGQRVRAVDHRFALSRPALLSAPDKIVGQRQLAALRVPRLHVHRRGCFRLRLPPEYPGSAVQELRRPGRDLVRVYVELLRQLGERPLAPHGSQGHLGLEGVWFRRGRRVILSPALWPSWPLSGRNSTYRPVRICRASSLPEDRT